MNGRFKRIKKVITASGRVQYFLGDGLWFGRVGAVRAEQRLASGEWTLFQVADYRSEEMKAEQAKKIEASAH